MLKLARKIVTSINWRLYKIRHGILVHPDELFALHEQKHLNRLLQYLKVDCVFDVGANAGQYARMLRRKTGFTGRIISFEPIPSLADQIRQAAVGDDLWEVQEIALGAYKQN